MTGALADAAAPRVLGLLAGGALFWLMYFDLKDALRPEPRRLLAFAFVLGGFAAALALGLYALAARLGAPVWPGESTGEVLLFTLLLVGPIEEGAKAALAWAVLFRLRHFDEPIDGLVYAAALAIGFATVENALYLPGMPGWEGAARAVTSPLTHSLFAAVWGFGAGKALLLERGAMRALVGGGSLVLSALLHGAYDALLLRWNATIPAAAVVLVLWIATIVTARRLVKAASRGATS